MKKINSLQGALILAMGIASPYTRADNSPVVYDAREVLVRSENMQGQGVYSIDTLDLLPGEVIEFDEPAKLHVKELKLGQNAGLHNRGYPLDVLVEDKASSDKGQFQTQAFIQIEAGADGESGEDGEKAQDGLRGSSGGHGADAADGADGGHGNSISIITPHLAGDVILVTRGGDGGRGGRGGNGGNGGVGFSGADARVLYNFRGLDNYSIDMLLEIGALIGVPVVGQVFAILQIFNGLQIGDGFDGYNGGHGGDAGKGGHGGNGGDAGNIRVIFGSRDPNTRFLGNARGGLGGVGGPAGISGMGGPGGLGGKAGGLWSRDGKPGEAGERGAVAMAGEAGLVGKAGRVQIHQTGDPSYIRCFVVYERLIDVGTDPSVALDFLLRCE
jgi:hypothetical protein